MNGLFALLLLLILPLVVDGQQGTTWGWAGAVTNSSAVVVARAVVESLPVTFFWSTLASLELGTAACNATLPVGGGVRCEISGLEPSTLYFWGVLVQGALAPLPLGQFRTLPPPGSSLRFAISGCANSGSNASVFRQIRDSNVHFFVLNGDMHYADIAVNDSSLFVAAFDQVHASGNQRYLYSGTSLVYVWDDHDFGPNNADSSNPAKGAAQAAFRQMVPSHPLALAQGAIYRSFDIMERFLFVVTDLRSELTSSQVMSTTQAMWFMQVVQQGFQRNQTIFWVSTFPWISPEGGDGWGKYPVQRRQLADFMASLPGLKIHILCGDMHGMALDDGTNNRYSSAGSVGGPVVQAAALDRSWSYKGGPYSQGCSVGGGRFVLVDVAPDDCVSYELRQGESIFLRWSSCAGGIPSTCVTPLTWGQIVGIVLGTVLGTVAFLVIVIVIVNFIQRRRKASEYLGEGQK